MKIIRSNKYRFYPSASQEAVLDNWMRLTRMVQNLAIEQQRIILTNKNRHGWRLSAYDIGKEITLLKRENPELYEVPPDILGYVGNNVRKSVDAYFDNWKKFKQQSGKTKKSGKTKNGKPPSIPNLPQFVSWRDDFSLTYMRGRGFEVKSLDGKYARIYGFPRMLMGLRVKYHKPVEGRVVMQSVIREGYGADAKWYLCVTFEKEVHGLKEEIRREFKNPVGIDVGITRTIQTSNGPAEYRNMPYDLIESLQARKKVLQRRLKNKVGGKRGVKNSNNYAKAYRRIAKIDEKIARIRQYHNKMIASEIAKAHDFVAVENLKVANMTRSAKGTVENPGTNVKQKSGLNRALLNTAPSFFRSFLKTKCEEYGTTFVQVDPRYTSQRCSKCGAIDKKNRLTQAVFKCTACEYTVNADYNAAVNIRDVALDAYKNDKIVDGIVSWVVEKKDLTSTPKHAILEIGIHDGVSPPLMAGSACGEDCEGRVRSDSNLDEAGTMHTEGDGSTPSPSSKMD